VNPRWPQNGLRVKIESIVVLDFKIAYPTAPRRVIVIKKGWRSYTVPLYSFQHNTVAKELLKLPVALLNDTLSEGRSHPTECDAMSETLRARGFGPLFAPYSR